MDIFFPTTDLERSKFKETAIECGFDEVAADSTANIESMPAHERLSILLAAWTKIGDYLTKNQYNPQIENTVSFVGRSTLTLWFGREWIACSAENKASLIDQMMKVFPTAYITMHPYSWPYMFSVYRDPWMVEYLNINFQRMSGPDLTPTLESTDSEFMQQEGVPLLILRMVNMFDFSMVKLVKFMCLRLLLTWENETSTASRSLRACHKSDEYIDYARHIYLMAVCEINGFKDLHYTLETIQRNVNCESVQNGCLEIGARTIAKGLQESKKTLTELLMSFLLKVPRVQLNNIFGGVLSKYTSFLTEYQLRKLSSVRAPKLSRPFEEVYSKLIEMFIWHRESSDQLLKDTPKISEELFSKVYNLTASKCAYKIFKLKNRSEWYTTKVTLLLAIISEEINVVQDYKYNDIQSTDELIEKEKELAIYYQDLAKIFSKTPYLEQEAWLTTFSLHPCKEFLEAVTRCGSRNLRAIKKQAHKLKVIESPESKVVAKKENGDESLNTTNEENELIATSTETKTTHDPHNLPSTSSAFIAAIQMATNVIGPDSPKVNVKPKPKRPPRKRPEKSSLKSVQPKTVDSTTKGAATEEKPTENLACTDENLTEADKLWTTELSEIEKPPEIKKRGRPIGALGKTPKSEKSSGQKTTKLRQKLDEKPDLAEEIFAAAAGAAENIHSQTVESIKYPAFALMNSVTDTEDLMKFTNYDKEFEQYDELNRILMSISLNHTKHEDILALIIAPRYKRLTWAVSWKKLKKRCRVIITKVNRKRELVEQSMADANDRLTHLNIDYDKYKDKPQIDYGTIEGGYECFDTDSDDDKPNTVEVQAKKPARKPVVGRARRKKLMDVVDEAHLEDKPILKIENLDTSQSNLLNSIEPTQLSKPLYLNKPVYIVRNPLSSPPSETAISFETCSNIKAESRTSSRRSTGETTLTSDSFEEHHWQVTTVPVINSYDRRKSLEQALSSSQYRPNILNSRSAVKTEPTFNIPASIKQQLEHPTMFFKPQFEENLNVQTAVPNNDLLNTNSNFSEKTTKPSELPPLIYFSPEKIQNQQITGAGANDVNTKVERIARFSPKLFEDMPEDLTMPKTSNAKVISDKGNLLQLQPLNLVNELSEQITTITKKAPRKRAPKVKVEGVDPPKKPRKRVPKQQVTTLKVPKVTKRQPKAGGKSRGKKNSDLKTDSTVTLAPCSLSSVRITPPSKQANGTRINPTAAVAISSAAASYHRTPYLNNQQEGGPNILQQLLSGENNTSGNSGMFDVAPVTNIQCSQSKVDFRDGANATAAVKEPPAQQATSTTFPGSQLEVSTCNSTDYSLIAESKHITNLSTTPNSSAIDLLGNRISTDVFSGEKHLSSIGMTFTTEESLSLLPSNYSEESITLKSVADSVTREESLVADPAQFVTISSEKLPVIDKPSTHVSSEQWGNSFDGESLKALLPNKMENDANVENALFGVSGLIATVVDESKKADFLTKVAAEKKTLDDFVFKVPAPVPKPCFFKQLKKARIAITIPSWAQTIFKNSIIESTPLTSSQNQTDDILYDNQKVFNPKLLDPHLKTYKNIKSSIRAPDGKKSDEFPQEMDMFLSDNSSAREAMSTMSNSPPPIASTSKQFVHTARKFEEQDNSKQESEAPLVNIAKRKRIKRPTPSKRLAKMDKRIETIIKASKAPLNDFEDPSSKLVNIFGAQVMNQAKCIHFNYAYLKEVECLKLNASKDDKVDCEASILIACPEPSTDATKLVKAFQKSNMFKGLNVGGGEVSLTSALAKEVLGTVVKVTLNKSDIPEFDPSDVLDNFTRWRRDMNSPTFYSPTLSDKHLKNGTLAAATGYLDVVTKEKTPQQSRKRSSLKINSATSPVRPKVLKKQKNGKGMTSESELNSSDDENQPSIGDNSSISAVHSESDSFAVSKELTSEKELSAIVQARPIALEDRTALVREGLENIINDTEVEKEKESSQAQCQKELQISNKENPPPDETNFDIRQHGEISSEVLNEQTVEDIPTSVLENNCSDVGKEKPSKENSETSKQQPCSTPHNQDLVVEQEIPSQNKRFHLRRNSSFKKYLNIQPVIERKRRKRKQSFVVTRTLPEEENVTMELQEPQQEIKDQQSVNQNVASDNAASQSLAKNESVYELSALKPASEDVNFESDLSVGQFSSPKTQKLLSLHEEPMAALNEQTISESPIKISSSDQENADKGQHLQSQLKMPSLKPFFEEDDKVFVDENDDKVLVVDKDDEVLVSVISAQQNAISHRTTGKQKSYEVITIPIEEKSTINPLEESPPFQEDVSDDDKPLQPRLKVPSLKINLPTLRRRRNRVTNRLTIGRKAVLRQRRMRRNASDKGTILKLKKEESEVSTKKICLNLTDSDEDIPLKTQRKMPLLEKESLIQEKSTNQPLKEIQIGTKISRTRSSTHVDDSDEDVPLIPLKQTITEEVPPSAVIRGRTKIPNSGHSSRRPSVRIQSKHPQEKNQMPIYSALYLDESDEDKLLKPIRLRATPDRAWVPRTKVLKKRKTLPLNKIRPNTYPANRKKANCPIRRKRVEYSPMQKEKSTDQIKRKKPFRRVLVLTHTQRKKRVAKPRIPVIKMPVLTREDCDPIDLDNIYECATMSTANETDEDAGSDYRPRRPKRKVVKPMRIRCVSRRVMPSDVLQESSSCSSPANVQKNRQFAAKSTSLPAMSNRHSRSSRKKVIESGFVISQLIDESSSSSNQMMVQPRKRRFAAKSTSKSATNSCRVTNVTTHELSSNDIAAIEKHNCLKLEVRLHRLTASDANLCRKPCIRLERNFVQNYLAAQIADERNAEVNDVLDVEADE